MYVCDSAYTNTAKTYKQPLEALSLSFLVGVFEENARLLQWLVFSSVQRDRFTFCTLCTLPKVLSTSF